MRRVVRARVDAPLAPGQSRDPYVVQKVTSGDVVENIWSVWHAARAGDCDRLTVLLDRDRPTPGTGSTGSNKFSEKLRQKGNKAGAKGKASGGSGYTDGGAGKAVGKKGDISSEKKKQKFRVTGLLLESRDKEHRRTPLQWACRGGHTEAVQLLLARKADVNAVDGRQGNTVLHYCLGFGTEAMLRMLLNELALDPIVRNKKYRTAAEVREPSERARVEEREGPSGREGEREGVREGERG